MARSTDAEGTAAAPSFFDGVPTGEVQRVLSELERRHYDAGSIVIAEGDKLNEIVILQEGRAEIFVSDRQGMDHRVGRAGPGASLGEMSLFTGKPTTGTVRAATDLDVLVMNDIEFERLAAAHPVVFRNLGAILSERLAKTNRLVAHGTVGHLGLLVDRGAPPELAWAIACSVAWHTRTRTLLLSLGEASEDLTSLAERARASHDPRAHLLVVPSAEAVRGRSLTGRVEDLFQSYEQILVLTHDEPVTDLTTARVLNLAGSSTTDGHAASVRAWLPAPERPGPDDRGTTRVPPLEPRDVEALQQGLLPATSPAGKAIGWLARDLAGLKVGLALGAGSIRGYAHFGVLHALRRLDLPIDFLTGTSVGALASGCHAVGLSPAQGSAAFDGAGAVIFRPTLSIRGMLSNRGLARYFREVTHDRRIEDLPMRLGLVAADIESQREVVFRRGPVWIAMLGSMSVPGIYPAVRVGRHTVVDGGILNPVPSSTAAAMGADVVVAVKLTGSPPSPEAEAEAVHSAGRRPTSLSVLLRAIDIMYSRLQTDSSDATMIAVTPEFVDLPGAKLKNFTQGNRYVEAGADAVEAALPRLAAALPWLRR